MITEDYVSFEVAKLLKEKGFDELSRFYYFEPRQSPEMFPSQREHRNTDKVYGENTLIAPTHQMAMKWLRKNHIIIVVQPEYFNGGSECSYWGVDIWADDNYEKLQGDFPAYEQAVEAALKYCLENLI